MKQTSMRPETETKKLRKKLFAITMSLCMILTLLPSASGIASAGETNQPEKNATITEAEYNCGYTPLKCIHSESKAIELSETVNNAVKNNEQSITAERNSYYSSGAGADNGLLGAAGDETAVESRYARQYLLAKKAEAIAANNTENETKYEHIITAYDRIVEAIDANPGTNIYVHKKDETPSILGGEAETAYNMVLEDYPEFFWFGTGYTLYTTYYKNNPDVQYIDYIAPAYLFDTPSEIATARAQYNAKVSEILTKLKAEQDYSTYKDYDKELWIHDYIAQNCEYVLSATYAHAAYGALVEGQAVCEGYTRAFQHLLNELDIECTTVTGSSDNTATTANHIWNAVKIDGKWYQVDLTWDDQGTDDMEISYRYFNIMTETMAIDHFLMNESNLVDLPECTEIDGWYFNVNSDKIVSEENLEDVDIECLGKKIAGEIKDDGYARIFVPYIPSQIGNSYMYASGDSYELGTLGNAVLKYMNINGGYGYGARSYGPEGSEIILYMYSSSDSACLGDVNDDGEVNALDALILKRHIADWGGAYDEIDTLTANINGDDKVNMEDLLILEKHIAGCEGYEDLSLYYKCKAS